MLISHIFRNAIGTQRFHFATHVYACFANRLANGMSSITANYDATSLGHKGTQCTDISFDDDVAALERNATPCGGVPFNYQQPTVGSCRSRLRCMSFNMDLAR